MTTLKVLGVAVFVVAGAIGCVDIRREEETAQARQQLSCDLCPPIASVTVVQQVGDEGAPTQEQLDLIQASTPPGWEDPTLLDVTLAAEAVLEFLPDELEDQLVDELLRIGGARIGCIVDRTATCYVRIGQRTYFCSIGALTGCGSHL